MTDTPARRSTRRRPRLTARLIGALGMIQPLAAADLEGMSAEGGYAGYTDEELDFAVVWLQMTIAAERRRVHARENHHG